MSILLLGVVAWTAVHLFPLYAPARRDALAAQLGEVTWKLAFTALSLATVALIVWGWRGADPVALYSPPAFLWHVNNLLMLAAFVIFGAGHATSNLRRVVRNPQLTAVKVWAVAHLLVNGDLRSWVLFGGMAVWAGLSVMLLKRRDGAREKPPATPRRNDVIHVVVSVAAYAVFALALHRWLFGVSPFPG